HLHCLSGIDLILSQGLCRAQFEDVESASDLRSVDVTVVPVSRPVAAQYQHLRINRSAIEICNLNRMVGVGKVHHRDAALIPGLHFYVAAGNRNERTVVGYTVLAVALCRRHLVVARETQLVVLQTKDSVGAPLVRIVGTATSAQSPSPLVREDDL